MKNTFVFLIGLLFSMGLRADVLVTKGWVKLPVGNMKTTAAFMTLTNTGSEDVTVIAAKSPVASSTEIHLMTHSQGMMRMRQVPQVIVPVGGEVKLEAGGLHIMMMGLKQELVVGQTVPVELVLKSGQRIQQRLTVR